MFPLMVDPQVGRNLTYMYVYIKRARSVSLTVEVMNRLGTKRCKLWVRFLEPPRENVIP